MTHARIAAAAVLAAGTLTTLSGCIHGSSSSRESGTRVGARTFERIVPGETTQGWVMATLGEPSRRSTYDDGRELWVYNYSKMERSKGSFLIIIGGSDESEMSESTFIEFEDGVVTEAWKE